MIQDSLLAVRRFHKQFSWCTRKVESLKNFMLIYLILLTWHKATASFKKVNKVTRSLEVFVIQVCLQITREWFLLLKVHKHYRLQIHVYIDKKVYPSCVFLSVLLEDLSPWRQWGLILLIGYLFECVSCKICKKGFVLLSDITSHTYFWSFEQCFVIHFISYDEEKEIWNLHSNSYSG